MFLVCALKKLSSMFALKILFYILFSRGGENAVYKQIGDIRCMLVKRKVYSCVVFKCVKKES